ncbi:MAG: M28 family peptidase [Bacteroidetes bacterium]|nr:M28 family peptidase [Bacteroidota bacterium]
MRLLFLLCVLALGGGSLTGCEDTPPPVKNTPADTPVATKPARQVPEFNGDTAYAFVQKQLSFGPRVPMTPGHARCADWLVSKFRQYGLETQVQQARIQDHRDRPLELRNIIASYNPRATFRVMLSAHWDTRPVADADTKRQGEPIPGANDGASGVAVLLEIARVIQGSELPIGVDFMLWDAEDGGESQNDNSWCHGSRYWARNRHKPGYSPAWAINLDMVGAKDATFLQEGFSRQSAPQLVKRIWQNAASLGYGSYFLFANYPPILDDHAVVGNILGIAYVDIIHLNLQDEAKTFFEHWHTHGDDIQTIDPRTLKAVGHTVLYTLFQEPV